MMNKFSKITLCASVALAGAVAAQAQKVELTPQFCNAVKQYEVVQTFYDGMAAVMKDGKWGYINSEGKEVIACSIPKTFDVCLEREDYGFYRDNGYVRNFSEGMVPVAKEVSGAKHNYERSLKWGYMNKEGKLVVDYTYDEAADFSEGLAWVANEDFQGFIDAQGNKVLNGASYYVPDAGMLNYAFKSGLACVVKMDDEGNAKYGYIDKQGLEVVACKYDAATPFSEGKAAVAVYKEDNAEAQFPYLYSYIDTKGNVLFSCQEGLKAGDFHEGMAWVTADAQQYGFIDTTGTQVIPQRYYTDEVAMPKFIADFNEGYTLSGMEDYVGTETFTVYRLMDKMMVRPPFKVEGPVCEGVALNSADKKFGFIKPDGTQVIPCQYDYTPSCVAGDMISSTYRFSNGVAAVRKDGKWGYIDLNGNSTF
ncbi:MAG: WG repeat-containing protein [Bacteroidales bacterium]|nr:WG repeat-containing protein [Bacteroidales bacterium]